MGIGSVFAIASGAIYPIIQIMYGSIAGVLTDLKAFSSNETNLNVTRWYVYLKYSKNKK